MKYIYLPENGVILDKETAFVTSIIVSITKQKDGWFYKGQTDEIHKFTYGDCRSKSTIESSDLEWSKAAWIKIANAILDRDATKTSNEIKHELKIDTKDAIKKVKEIKKRMGSKTSFKIFKKES